MQVLTRRFLLYFKKIDKTTDQFSKLTFSSRLLDPWNYSGWGLGVCLKKILILHRDYHFTVFCPNTYHQVEQALKLTRQKRWNLLLCWVLFQTSRPAWSVARCNLLLCDLLSLFDHTEVEEKQDTLEKGTVPLNFCWEEIAEVFWNQPL